MMAIDLIPSLFRSKSVFDLLPQQPAVSLTSPSNNNAAAILVEEEPSYENGSAPPPPNNSSMVDIEEAVAATPLSVEDSSRRRHPLHDTAGESILRLSLSRSNEEGQASASTRVLPLALARDTSGTVQHSTASSFVSNGTSDPQLQQPRVVHPVLLKLPLSFRFGCNGLVANILFMLGYNWMVSRFAHIPASTVYSICYMIYIPTGHLMNSLFVFGWPDRYFPSLMSNFPIGLTAIAMGGALTAYLDRIEFNERIEDYMRDNFTFSQMPARTAEDKKSEFYSSLLVLVVTSIWTYVLSVYINSPPTKSEKED